MGLLLRDLTFLNDGNPKTLKAGVYNFSKMRRVAEPIFFVQMLKRQPYTFSTSRLSLAIQQYLKVPNAMTEQTVLYSCSLLCEPRHAGDGDAVPERLIEKWARENNVSEEQERKQLEAWSKRMARQNSFIKNKEVLAEMGMLPSG